MSGIAFLLPNEEMCQYARKLVKEDDHVLMIKKIKTENAVSEARDAISAGANIIVARGRQAAEIKNYTNIPLVEITLTAQELGLLVLKAKKMIGREDIHIGVFVWGKMLCDTTHFQELYGARLTRYEIDENIERSQLLEAAIADGVDIIIGVYISIDAAMQKGIPSLFLEATNESIEIALSNAKSMYYMHEIEQRNTAQFSAVLDSSFGGIIKIGNNGNILVMNQTMEQMAGASISKAIGRPVSNVLKDLDMEAVQEILDGVQDNYSTFITIDNQSLVVAVEPIVVDGEIEGAIISCNRMKRIENGNKNQNSEQFLRGYVAAATFADIDKKLKGLSGVVERAKIYAQSSSPMLVEAMSCPELDLICQAIHNYGLHRNGPFIMINLAGMTQDQQMRALFGDQDEKGECIRKGAIEDANHGTLVIQSIDKLTLPAQYNLVRAIRSRRLIHNDLEKMKILDFRLIACSGKNLAKMQRKFEFRSDLFYMLKSLSLRIPPLLERQQDLEFMLDTYTRRYMEQYSRYNVMSAGAKRYLLEYPWKGTSIQLESFCERMILTVGKRTITEEYVRSLTEELYGEQAEEMDLELTEQESQSDPAVLSEAMPNEQISDPMYQLLRNTLYKYHGNRKLTAKELGMSTTTLWRRMKKYGLEE